MYVWTDTVSTVVLLMPSLIFANTLLSFSNVVRFQEQKLLHHAAVGDEEHGGSWITGR